MAILCAVDETNHEELLYLIFFQYRNCFSEINIDLQYDIYCI